MKTLVINGSYREDGVTERAIDYAIKQLELDGHDTEQVVLRDFPIEFCTNCRQCMQEPGERPGRCVLNDGMGEIVQRIEQADAFIIAAPVNFGSVTAVFKRFMERLAVYAYWPTGTNFPTFRKAKLSPKKKALIISSSAAPGLLGRFAFGSLKQLENTADVIGAKTVATVFVGFADKARESGLTDGTRARLSRSAERLAA